MGRGWEDIGGKLGGQQPTDAMPGGAPRQMPNGGHWILNRNYVAYAYVYVYVSYKNEILKKREDIGRKLGGQQPTDAMP